MYVGSGSTYGYFGKSMEYLASLNAVSNVIKFFITIDFTVSEDIQKMFPSVMFLRKDPATMKAANKNYCLQHGDFLPELRAAYDLNDDDIIVYTDSDMIIQHQPKAWEVLKSLKSIDVGVVYNAGELDTLFAEYNRLEPEMTDVQAEREFGNLRMMPCYNTGVIVTDYVNWCSLFREYIIMEKKYRGLFKHYASQQWFLSYIIQQYFSPVILPGWVHCHGKYGVPVPVSFKDHTAYFNNEKILFRHAIPEARKTILCIYPLESGTGYWRMKTKINALRRLYPDRYNIIETTEYSAEQVVIADLIIIHSIYSMDAMVTTMNIRKPGTKIIVDIDDYIFAVDKNNPAYKSSKEHIPHIQMTLTNCDYILVSTPTLGRMLEPYSNKQWGKQIFEWKNFLNDFDHPQYENKSDEIIIGWQGGSSHKSDFQYILPALLEVLKKYPKVKLRFVGDIPIKEGLAPVKDRISLVQWDNPGRYMKNLKGITIGIAPLNPDVVFNKCKSNIKWMEYGYLGIPCVASDSPTYESIKDNVDGFKCKSIKEFVKRLSQLIESEELRTRIGQAAKARVEKEYLMSKNVDTWKDVLALGKIEYNRSAK